MTEHEEFADALLDQISVELNEEKDIANLSTRIGEDKDFTIRFDTPAQISNQVSHALKERVAEFT